jgi:preprotein translocase subunit SecY
MQCVEFASQFRKFHMGSNDYNIDIQLTMVNVVIIIVLVVVFMFKIKCKLCCMYEKTTQTKITQIFTKDMKTATNLPINN